MNNLMRSLTPEYPEQVAKLKASFSFLQGRPAVTNDRPKQDRTADGRRIVYPIWRDDLAEATILLEGRKENMEGSCSK